MLEVRATTRFKKEVKKAARQQRVMQRLAAAIDLLQAEEPLPERHLDHALTGNYVGHRECHLSPDWLLIYKIEENTLILVRTGRTANCSAKCCSTRFYAKLLYSKSASSVSSKDSIDCPQSPSESDISPLITPSHLVLSLAQKAPSVAGHSHYGAAVTRRRRITRRSRHSSSAGHH